MAAGFTNIGVRDSGGTWRTPTEVHVRDSGGTWRDCQEAHVRDSGGTWRHSWVKSDEVLYAWNPASLESWRPSTWRTTARNVGSYSFGDHWTLMDLTTVTSSSATHSSDSSPATNMTIADALAERPVINTCSIHLSRDEGGASTINSGTYYIGYNTGGYGSGTPAISGTHQTSHSLASAGWAYNSTRVFSGLGDLGSVMDTNSLIIANNTSPVYPGGDDADYTNIDPSTTAHTFYMRLDYS